jgi:L-asparaginase II
MNQIWNHGHFFSSILFLAPFSSLVESHHQVTRLFVTDRDGRELFEMGSEARVHDLNLADGERFQSVCVAHAQDLVVG